MRTMANLLKRGRPPSDVMALIDAEDDRRGPYQPCACGSGQKFRFCHGSNAPTSPFEETDPGAVLRPGFHAGGLAPPLT